MDDPWKFIGYVISIVFILVFFAIIAFIVKGTVSQMRADHKRKRAHAGKLRCEDKKEDCKEIATRVTPRGYFCETHHWENSTKYTATGSWSWAHKLNHTFKQKEV